MKGEAKVRPADQSIIATQRGDSVLTPTNNPPRLCSTSSQPWTDLVTLYDLVLDTALAVAYYVGCGYYFWRIPCNTIVKATG